MTLTRQQIAFIILKFAQNNGLKIHPGQDPLQWGDLLIKKGGHCPCVPTRDRCPCEFVLEDIRELGRCRCGLFCNDDYILMYAELKAQGRHQKEWKQRRKRSS
ncbi:MAG: hypothetical protein JRE40_06535 [Deltaproteobacteria bacterium]|nr:hypothetical protein [Deltaproteobacteria bacterium]